MTWVVRWLAYLYEVTVDRVLDWVDRRRYPRGGYS